MGMFDYVRCNRLLPDGLDGSGIDFQTKDFDCNMNKIEITADGRLVEHAWEWDGMVPKEERPYPDAPEDSLLSLCGSMKTKQLPPQDLEHHGVMEFYGDSPDGVWHEYHAKFTDGALTEIVSLNQVNADAGT